MFGQQPSGSFRTIGPAQRPGYPPQTPGQQVPGQQASQESFNQYRQAAVPFQAQKDMAAFGALQNLGVAGMNAMGQYGANRDTSLANQSIAAANAYGSMANSAYNAFGQMGQIGAGITAAGLEAGAQSAMGNMGGNFDMSMSGNNSFNFGGGGRGGFNAQGPEGTISRGRYGGGGGRGGPGASTGFKNRGSGGFNTQIQKGSTEGERGRLINQGYGFLGGLANQITGPNNPAAALGGLMRDEFGANRAAIMDPTISNSLNSQVAQGYGALGGLYGMSDYGFNTGSKMAAPKFTPQAGQAAYWNNPQRWPTSQPSMTGGSWF